MGSYIKHVLFCLIISSSCLLSQLQDANSSISLSVAGALPFSSPPSYDLINNGISVKIPPGLFGSIGIVYSPLSLKIINPTQFSLCVELSYAQLKSEEPSGTNYYSQMKLSQSRAMVWLHLFVPATLNPFVRAGIGITQVRFNENSTVGKNFSFNNQSLAFGIGGGVSLSVVEQFALEVFGDAIFTARDFAVMDDRNTNYCNFQVGAEPMLGLRMILKL